jgi:DNA-binding transcriptional LysR family regulator
MSSELSSNEAIKQMCVAGFAPAYLSLLTCPLELNAGLLKVLPLPNNPTISSWHVVRLSGQPIPKVASAFEAFLINCAAAEILAPIKEHLPTSPSTAAPGLERKLRVARARAA